MLRPMQGEAVPRGPYWLLAAFAGRKKSSQKPLRANRVIKKRASLKNEAEQVEARLRELIGRQPPHPIATRAVAIAFQHPALRIEENRVTTLASGAETKGLRITPAEGSAGVATIVPLLPDGRMVMVARYHYAAGNWSLEFPRGQGQADDVSWAKTAERILSQESGLTAESIKLLGAVKPEPRIMSFSEIVVLANGCTYRPEHRRDHQQLIAGTLDVKPECLDRLILRGCIDCGTTLAALCLYRAQFSG